MNAEERSLRNGGNGDKPPPVPEWPTRPCADLRPHKRHLSVPVAAVNRKYTHWCDGRETNDVD